MVMGNNLFNNTIYLNSPDNKYRYALGTKGENTLYCFGINPSTATPEKYDPTITRVSHIARKNGFDSFVMLNIYPIRATNPDDLPDDVSLDEHNHNRETILSLIKDNSTVWVAWGDLITKRHWLKICWNDILIYILLNKRNITWVKMGELTKNGNPRHPLYLKYQPFSKYCRRNREGGYVY
jgi:hypothetical protein